MTLPDLQPEIWAVIFKFLRRQPPPPWAPAKIRDFHQDDLTAVCRVSSMFHETAYPILYTSVCVNDVGMFFDHLDDASESLNAKVTSKIDRLKRVRHLRLPGLRPECEASFTVHGVLETGDWSRIAESDTVRHQRMVEEAVQEVGTLKALAHNHRLPEVLGDFETVIIGSKHACGWKHITTSSTFDQTMIDALHSVRSELPMLLIEASPRHVCVYQYYGPLALRYFDFPAELEDTIFTYHFGDISMIESCFLFGATVRYITDPGTSFVYDGPSQFGTFVQDLGLFGLTRRLIALDMLSFGTMRESIPKSKIEYYGFFDPYPIDDEAEGAAVGTDYSTQLVTARLAESELRKGYMDVQGSKWPQIWKDRVRLAPYDEAPCCEACGWTVDTGTAWAENDVCRREMACDVGNGE